MNQVGSPFRGEAENADPAKNSEADQQDDQRDHIQLFLNQLSSGQSGSMKTNCLRILLVQSLGALSVIVLGTVHSAAHWVAAHGARVE